MSMLSSFDLLTIQLCCDCKLYTNFKLETKNKPFHDLLVNEIEINNQLRNMDTKVVFHVTCYVGIRTTERVVFVINILIFI